MINFQARGRFTNIFPVSSSISLLGLVINGTHTEEVQNDQQQ